MTPAQDAAFQAGSEVTSSTLLTAIASVVIVLAFVCLVFSVPRVRMRQRRRDEMKHSRSVGHGGEVPL